MPIPVEEWRLLIRESLLRLADRNYQALAWFNKHEEQTSPEEQICQILGDYGFNEFIHSPKTGLSIEQRQSALELIRKLEEFGGDSHAPFDPYRTIDDPNWAAIRMLSKEVLESLFPERPEFSGK